MPASISKFNWGACFLCVFFGGVGAAMSYIAFGTDVGFENRTWWLGALIACWGFFVPMLNFFNFDDRNPSRLAWVGVFSGWAAFSYALLNMAISPFVVMGVNGWVKWFCLFVGVMGNVGWVAWVWKAYALVCRQAKISGDLCSDWSSHMLVRHDFANKIFDKAGVNIHMPAILIVPFAPLFLLGFMVSPILNQAVGEAGAWIVVALLMIPSSVYFNGMFVRVVMMHLYLPICLGRNSGVKVFSMPVVF